MKVFEIKARPFSLEKHGTWHGGSNERTESQDELFDACVQKMNSMCADIAERVKLRPILPPLLPVGSLAALIFGIGLLFHASLWPYGVPLTIGGALAVLATSAFVALISGDAGGDAMRSQERFAALASEAEEKLPEIGRAGFVLRFAQKQAQFIAKEEIDRIHLPLLGNILWTPRLLPESLMDAMSEDAWLEICTRGSEWVRAHASALDDNNVLLWAVTSLLFWFFLMPYCATMGDAVLVCTCLFVSLMAAALAGVGLVDLRRRFQLRLQKKLTEFAVEAGVHTSRVFFSAAHPNSVQVCWSGTTNIPVLFDGTAFVTDALPDLDVPFDELAVGMKKRAQLFDSLRTSVQVFFFVILGSLCGGIACCLTDQLVLGIVLLVAGPIAAAGMCTFVSLSLWEKVEDRYDSRSADMLEGKYVRDREDFTILVDFYNLITIKRVKAPEEEVF